MHQETDLCSLPPWLKVMTKIKVDVEMKVLGLCFLRFGHVLVPVDKATDQYALQPVKISNINRSENTRLLDQQDHT